MEYDFRKYSLVKMQKVNAIEDLVVKKEIDMALAVLKNAGVLVDALPSSEDEFFPIMLKDQYAPPALFAYAYAIREYDPDLSASVFMLNMRAGESSPYCKLPD